MLYLRIAALHSSNVFRRVGFTTTKLSALSVYYSIRRINDENEDDDEGDGKDANED